MTISTLVAYNLPPSMCGGLALFIWPQTQFVSKPWVSFGPTVSLTSLAISPPLWWRLWLHFWCRRLASFFQAPHLASLLGKPKCLFWTLIAVEDSNLHPGSLLHHILSPAPISMPAPLSCFHKSVRGTSWGSLPCFPWKPSLCDSKLSRLDWCMSQNYFVHLSQNVEGELS